jgi:hypothetical protein
MIAQDTGSASLDRRAPISTGAPPMTPVASAVAFAIRVGSDAGSTHLPLPARKPNISELQVNKHARARHVAAGLDQTGLMVSAKFDEDKPEATRWYRQAAPRGR